MGRKRTTDRTVRAAVFALIGSVSELSSCVRQRRERADRDSRGTLLFEVVTSMVDGETILFSGRTLRVSGALDP